MNAAVLRSQQSIADRYIPASHKLLETVMKLRADYGVDTSSDALSSEMQKYQGLPWDMQLERAADTLSKPVREKRAVEAQVALEAQHKADVEAAFKRGSETARKEYETSHIQGEDSGSGSVLGVIPLNSPPEGRRGVEHTTYDKAAGTLAQKYMDKYRQLEREGLYKLATQ